ncbi:MAG: flagellar basal body rod protein FlgF [Betaproteobacteria bacterium]
MDKLVYTAMTGARMALARQDTLAQNLANVSTPGYRAESAAFRAVPLVGSPTRVFALESTPGADLTPGTITQTGRSLDVAVSGSGWIAVEGRDGREAYTRNGGLQVSAEGMLQTAGGLNVLSDGGALAIPAGAAIRIGADGTVSALPAAQPNAVISVGRIKLTNPPAAALERSADGLFRMKDGGAAPPDEALRLVPGAIEGSNVNVVEALVGMISVARQFDLQMKLMQNAEGNEQHASRLLSIQS